MRSLRALGTLFTNRLAAFKAFLLDWQSNDNTNDKRLEQIERTKEKVCAMSLNIHN